MRVETNSHTYTIMNSIFSQFDVAEFPKTPSPKPARTPPQTPPAGGKSAEAGRIQNPRQIVSPYRFRFSILAEGVGFEPTRDFYTATV